MRLTPRQSKFVDSYLVHFSGARAAREAGFSPNAARQIATENLSKPSIRQVITQKCKEAEIRLQLERDDVIRGLVSAIELAKSQGNPDAMIRACREIGLMLGFYHQPVERTAVSAESRRLLSEYEAMSDKELFGMAQGK